MRRETVSIGSTVLGVLAGAKEMDCAHASASSDAWPGL
jgi:hypothetical protein